MKKKEKLHRLDVRTTITDRMVENAIGLALAKNSDYQYQKGDLLYFHVDEDSGMFSDIGHPLMDQVWIVDQVYSGRGIEPGYVALMIKYKRSKTEEEEEEYHT